MTDMLATFKYHGVQFVSERGTQAYGDCIFCRGEKKFYTNKTNGLWDCKVCRAKGDVAGFLEQVNKTNTKSISSVEMDRLAVNRKMPVTVFLPWEIGKNGGTYTFPVRDVSGKVTDLRCYRFKDKLKGTAGCKVGLFGANLLSKSPINEPIFLCEGEWDGMAMHWLLRFLKKPGVVLAVPGANTFKAEWVPYFQGRTVYTLYDHDEAGRNGELLAHSRLLNVALKTHFAHWNNTLPDGYDIRDLIAEEAIKNKQPAKAFEKIMGMCQEHPRKNGVAVAGVEVKTEKVEPVTLEEVYRVVDKWLYLPNHFGIDMIMAVVLSTQMQGDPLWMFIVAPPGGAKTELLNAVSTSNCVYMTSSLTAHTLISGMMLPGGMEASLLPKLNNKTLAIKDFTSILGQPDMTKNEIFGQMRDAYDGYSGKDYGHGHRKVFKSHFSILAGVTPSIYHLGEQYTSLGERFLKFSIGDNLVHSHEKETIRKAISNVSYESVMREEISGIVNKFIAYRMSLYDSAKIPVIPEPIIQKMVFLSQFCARLRGNVVRDKYHTDVMLSRPSAEFGTRLAKQLTKQAIAIAMVHNRKEVVEEDYLMCRKTALDTISQRNEDIVRFMFKKTPTIDDSIKTAEIAVHTRYSVPTIQRLMADMDMLQIVQRTGKANAYEWTLSEYLRELVIGAGLYTTDIEVQRRKIKGGF